MSLEAPMQAPAKREKEVSIYICRSDGEINTDVEGDALLCR